MSRPINRIRVAPRWLIPLMAFVILSQPGCKSKSTAAYPNSPKVRIEGPAGTPIGYSVTYIDGPDTIDAKGTGKTIPASGVFTDDLKAGHKAVMVEVIPNGDVEVTLILLDGDKELERSKAKGKNETARVKAGNPAS